MKKCICILMILLFTICGILIFGTHVLVKDREREPERNIYESEVYSLKNETIVEFVPREGNIFSANIFLSNVHGNDNGYVKLEIKDESDVKIYEQEISLSEIKDNEWTEVSLDKVIRVSPGKKYSCVLQGLNCKQYPSLVTVMEELYPLEKVSSHYNGLELEHNVAFSFNYMTGFTGYMKIMLISLIFVLCVGGILVYYKGKIVITNKQYSYIYATVLGLLVIWISYLHLYNLQEVPLRLHIDEVATGYDAFCISNYGVDRFLTTFPVYFPNYGQGQSALCIYISALFMRLFGINLVTIRIPAIIFSYVTLIYGYKMVKMIYDNKAFTLLFVWLFGMVPYFTMASRWALDCNLMLGMSTVFLYYFYVAVTKGAYINYIFAGILGGLVLYTYCLSWVALPLFLILALAYLTYVKQINLRQLISLGIPMFIVALPLILFQFVNIFDLEDIKIGIFTIGKIPVYRSDSFYIKDYFINLIKAARYVLSHDGLPYNAFSGHYVLLKISIPFIVIGLFANIVKVAHKIRKKESHILVFLFMWFMAMGILAGTLDYPNINRMNAIFLILLLFLVEGIYTFYAVFKIRGKKLILFVCSLIMISEHLLWAGYYYDEYPNDLNRQYLSYGTMDSLVSYMDTELDEDISEQKTYFMGEYAADDLAIYYYLAKEIPPTEAQLYGRGDKEYNNFLFVKEHVEFENDCSYVIPDICKKNLKMIEAAGFTMIHLGEYYYCYYR